MIVRTLVLASFLAATTAVATASSASAGPADDPNADVASNVVCEDGQVFETLIGTGVAGHLPLGPPVGVAKSLHVLLERGAIRCSRCSTGRGGASTARGCGASGST
jgi:hypothetical protein